MSSVCVAHLVWAPLGIDPFKRFVSSYRQNSGGVAHRLLLIFNGFTSPSGLDEYYRQLEGLPFDSLVLPRAVFDIPAYYAAAESASETYVCFLNSYSVLLDEEWLAKLYGQVVEPGVGIVGATASYQSLYSSVKLSMHSIDGHYTPRRIAGEAWRRLILSRYKSYFGLFPNPHLRTNAFMMKRELMLALKRGRLRTKMDTIRFESGKQGLTRQLESMGLKALVIGRDGLAYEKERWFESETYRTGTQSNLLVSDNRTEEYRGADSSGRRLMTKITWGEDRASATAPDSV
jgi:hypothetical protein